MLKVGWFLLGDEKIASSRIHGINIHKYLCKKNVKSVILQINPVMTPNLTIPLWKQLLILISGFHVLIFQKVSDSRAIRLARLAKQLGVKTVFLQSDMIETKMVNNVDALVVTSDYLKRHYDCTYGTDAILIEDAVEVNDNLAKQDYRCDGKIQLVWVGHKDNWRSLDVIYKALDKLNDNCFCLKRISNHPGAEVQWKLETVFHEVIRGDIGIVPCLNDEWAKSKSNNRLTMFMALGLPVVASDIPSYRKILKHGHNGFLVESLNDWIKSFLILRDAKKREEIGRQGRGNVWQRYSLDIIGKQWTSLIDQLTDANRNRRKGSLLPPGSSGYTVTGKMQRELS